MKHTSLVMIPAIFILFLFPAICGAQEMMHPGPPGNAPMGKKHEAQFREWIWNNLKTYLKLDDAAAAKFKPIFQEHSETRGKLMHEHNQLIRIIDLNADNPSVPFKDLRDNARRLEIVNKSLITEWEKYNIKAKGILNELQQIKLLIYDDKLKEDIFKRMGKHSDFDRTVPSVPPDR
ncbi:MAG: hypothetical protein WCU00_00820 [Candidatus Latescibacterota bacterium]